ncbi:tRNA 2-selenouridine(34) synthase MnmH [Romeria aff. gracilis LEGE 07310]|uniref:tRNA 2-selenouridine(34) synthase MnmH n=1 Tax=Vasconcelosia minhoensis LEGE 07310 TaxID=915328 RepID=A0A8J7AZI0_9CYAN|nr:tRNA 2-selenouridine(34) synthase MnmH [Romeria gracilis]MBE9079272.1 tRNA 2-selenouridine(34) synthase MnmH [Romeria aff. gracilis LEGE 07310]
MSLSLAIEDFLTETGPILDVRSPGEYEQGHIPEAISFPLFTNDERAQVGTCYRHQGREAAVELGFELAGPKFAEMIRRGNAIAPDRTVRLHCWRGGMRSGAVAWVLSLAGFQVVTLAGGYKAFRRWVRCTLETPRPIQLLGGMTGTAKTDILQAMAAQGAQVLDLEGYANHRGSSFGALCLPPQPTTEQFENLVAMRWDSFKRDRPVWIEAESRRIGPCRIPAELFAQMEAAPAVEIVRPIEERLALLVDIYGQADPEDLVAATERIQKRLGGQRTQQAITLIRQGQLTEAFAILLDYYDRAYRYDLERRQKQIPQVDVTGLSPTQAVQRLLEKAQISSIFVA